MNRLLTITNLPKTYGDRVIGSPQDGFTYGEHGEGFTPDVTTSYIDGARMWSAGYRDLANALIENQVDAGIFDPLGDGIFDGITLSADPDSIVRLHDFDMAVWPTQSYTINSVSVVDGRGASLFSDNDVFIEGDGTHTGFDFGEPLSAPNLTIRFNSRNSGHKARQYWN